MTPLVALPVSFQEDELTPLCSDDFRIAATTIAQLAVRIIFPLATVMMLSAALPLTSASLLLPPIAIGVAFLSAFFFQPESFYCPPAESPFYPHTQKPREPRVMEGIEIPARQRAQLPVGAPRGIRNMGQNCWLNADLQLLASDPSIREWIRAPLPPLDPEPAGLAPGARALRVQEHFAAEEAHAAIKRFFVRMEQDVRNNQPVCQASSQEVRRALATMSEAIDPSPYRQEDAVEGISSYLNCLPNGLKIELENRLHCERGTKSKQEFAWSIPLTIDEKNPRFGHLIERFCSDAIDPAEQIRVELDENGTAASYPCTRKETHFVSAPPMLRFSLKRFVYERPPHSWLSKIAALQTFFPQLAGRVSKVTTSVETPHRLPLKLRDGSVAHYRLKSFNCHLGESANRGHYVAYVRNGDQWYLANDSSITRATQHQVDQALASGNSYMIWFEKEPG